MIFLIYFLFGLISLEFARRSMIALMRSQKNKWKIHTAFFLFFSGITIVISPNAHQEMCYAVNYWLNN